MSRFSEILTKGYNKQIIDKSNLKKGSELIIGDWGKAWFVSADDKGITVSFNSQEGNFPVKLVYDESALRGENVRRLTSIEGTPAESINVYSSNPKHYAICDMQYDAFLKELLDAGAQKKIIADAEVLAAFNTLVLIELIKPLPSSDTSDRSTYQHDTRKPSPLKVLKKYGVLGVLKNNESSSSIVQSITVLPDPTLTSFEKNLTDTYDVLNYFPLPCKELTLPLRNISGLYSLANLASTEPITQARAEVDELVQAGATLVERSEWTDLDTGSAPLLVYVKSQTDKLEGYYGCYGCVSKVSSWPASFIVSCSAEQKQAHESRSSQQAALAKFVALETVEVLESDIVAIYRLPSATPLSDSEGFETRALRSMSPYTLSTQPNGFLPDMSDFLLERAGSIDGGWSTSSTIKAGRPLAAGEVLSAFVIDRLAGDIRKIDYTAQAGKLSVEQWPKAFADHLAAAGEPMTAGNWSADNTFSTATKPLRLWSPARYRAFSNAPFAANIVQALACDESFSLAANETLCLQVRDLTSQVLYESHFYTAAAEQADRQWSKALCEQINRDSRVLKAGVLNDCSVVPADGGNAFWVPQCAELSVTLTHARWWQSGPVESDLSLEEGRTIQAWVYDAFSQRLLAHHTWTPSKAQRAAGKWSSAWAKALNASSVSPYLQVATHSPSTGQDNAGGTLNLWQRGDALRIFTTLPDLANRLPAGPPLESVWKGDPTHEVLVTVRHPFSHKLLHHALFKPAEGGSATDQQTWLDTLSDFILEQAWPEVQVDSTAGPLSVPRFSDLQVLLENVGDGTSSSSYGDYLKEVLETEDLASPMSDEKVRVTVTAGNVTVQLDIQSLNGELEFRLDDAAYKKGYRVAACTPRASEHPLWPVAVTDTRITWAGPIEAGVYDLYLTYPESARDSTTLTVGHIGAYHPTHFWHSVQAVQFTPPAAMKPYDQISFLCEDYGNTNHSEVFDTSNQDHTGVDERSGLFHAHYPIATLQGLLGLGPVCELTLHYSALRANEAGLGDGWAWRFSKIITSSIQEDDHRLLTLADGTPVVFSDEQWTQLGAGQPIKTKACRVTSNKDYSQITVEFPSGRQEILSKPAAPGSDEIEPNDAFRKKILQALKAIKTKSKPSFPDLPEKWTQWVLLVLSPLNYGATAMDYGEAVSAWETHGNTKELDRRIALYERPFVQLLPSRIVSQYGEALDLVWKRQKGQFLLMSIKSGESELFSAEYVNPEAKDGGQVNMQLWAGSPEAFKVELTLQHYLLRTLKRVQNGSVLQQVDCGYDDDPVLDRVLCRLQELDGSVECVQYVKKDATLKNAPSLPRVALHALLPGDGQQNHIDRYTYTGSFQDPDDQVFIAAVESGPHCNVVHDLHAFGLDKQGRRTPLLRGSGTTQAHWLEFSLPQAQGTTTFRYTGWGDELVEISERMLIKVKGEQLEVTSKATQIERQTAVLQLLWRYSTSSRKRLQSAIKHMLSLTPRSQREAFGKTLDATTVVTDAQGNPLRLHVKGSHSIYYCYYGEQTQNQITLGSLNGLSGVPTLECPEVPAHAIAPLMAEYQCDYYGNPQGLKLYGYRNVTRAGRSYLELAEVVMVDGLHGTLANDSLDKDATWQLVGTEALWHQISTTTSVPTIKKTPGGDSKVREWSITNKQATHRDGETVELTNVQAFIDNPNQPGIQVIVSATTAAGTAQVSKEMRSRYSRRALQKVERGVETHWERDASGRVTKETRYLLASGSTGKATHQVADECIDSVYDDSKKQVERTHKDGSQSLSRMDGLQRAWRTSWRRSDKEAYVPLEEHCFTDLDESSMLGSWVWDYLPGGQAVSKGTALRALSSRQSWLTQEVEVAADQPATIEPLSLIDTPFSRDQTVADICVDKIIACLGKIDTENPRKKFKSKWRNLDIEVNTISHAYIAIYDSLTAEYTYDVGTYNKNIGVKIANAPQLLKNIQALAGLAGLEGIEEITIPDMDDVTTPTKEELSDLIGSTDFFDTLKLFTASADTMNLIDEHEFEQAVADLKIYYRENLPNEDHLTKLDTAVKITELQNWGFERLSKTTTTTTAKTDGTFQRSVQWADEADTQHLQLDQHYDADGRVTRHVRTVGEQTQAYALERDSLGRITKVTRPDNTTIERAYHGFTKHVSTLTVDGKTVATQTVSDAGKLTKRKVGSREYGFADQAVTLPDKTQLQTLQSANGARFAANGSALYSEAHQNGSTLISAAAGSEPGSGWQHSITGAQAPGQIKTTKKTARGTIKGAEWQSLRGQRIAVLHADGHTRREFLDDKGRLLRSCQAHEDVLLRYDELDRLQARQVHALAGAGQWQVQSERDGFNRETVRTFLRNGAPCFKQQMTWRGDGRMASKASYQNGKLLRTERFTYDLLSRLESYTCDAEDSEHCPQDGNGIPIKAQTFSWDSLDNLTRCTSTPFQGDTVTKTFIYAAASDPTRLTSVKTGNQTTALTWNSNGHLQTDGLQRALAYNAAGQLSSVKDGEDALLTRYEYDGLQRVAAQYDAQAQTTLELRYDGDQLIGQVCFDQAGKATRSTHLSPGLAQYDGDQVRWLIDDPQLGIVGQVLDGELQLAPLLPFGEGAALDGLVSGYNGMRRDPVTGHYHAGNGYRCYDPALRRHAQPDWLSPFGEGGVNDYAHCPDPVNLHDPSGAIMLSRWGQDQMTKSYDDILRETKPMPVGGRWRGLVLSAVLTVIGIAASVMTGGAASALFIPMTICAVLSFGFEVASVLTEESNPELSKKLGYASLAFAVASLFECAAGLIKKLPALAKGAMRNVRQIGTRILRTRAITRPTTATARLSEYAMEQFPGLVATKAAKPIRRGMVATLKAKGSQWVDYLGAADSIDLSKVEYSRLTLFGKSQYKLNTLNNFAIQSRSVSALAWVAGKGVETYIVQGSIVSFINIAQDNGGDITPWGRYTVSLEQSLNWSQGGGGHLLA
ncbi:RHS repeat-associated core domain-containing protein [Pseudomonas sp. NPDC089422]|uniref:RHS repeat-associated core domain-containing protein n=1 Tax=Pseudomonas sp. NPDC089422 TaxID=3364466 RepID=UPI003812D7CE